jgi:Acetyltransferase (GNAT) domain
VTRRSKGVEGELRVDWVTGRNGLIDHAHTLRTVAMRAEADPFATPEFLLAYIDNFEYGAAPEPEIAVAWAGKDPVGFLATRIDRRSVAPKVNIRERSLLVTHDHDRLNLVCDPAEAGPVASAIVESLLGRRGVSSIDISGLTPGSSLHRALHHGVKSSNRWMAYDFDLPPYATVPTAESLAAYFASLSKTMRSNVSRQTRRLYASSDDVTLLFADGVNAASALFPALLELETRSWKYEAKAGMLRHPKRTNFFAEVIGGRAAYEPSVVGVMRDGVLIASLLLGSFGNRMWALEMAFDEAHADLGAGQLLLLLAMQQATDHNATSIGFLQHFAYFKKRWNAHHDEVVSTRLLLVGSPLHVRRLMAKASQRHTKVVGIESTQEWNEARRSALGSVKPHIRDEDVSRALVHAALAVPGVTVVTVNDAASLLPFPLR